MAREMAFQSSFLWCLAIWLCACAWQKRREARKSLLFHNCLCLLLNCKQVSLNMEILSNKLNYLKLFSKRLFKRQVESTSILRCSLSIVKQRSLREIIIDSFDEGQISSLTKKF